MKTAKKGSLIKVSSSAAKNSNVSNDSVATEARSRHFALK